MSPLLAHEEVRPESGPAAGRVCYLHGVFGAGRNWRSVARRLAEGEPAWSGILADLRLHGDSVGFPPPHTIAACAEDVVAMTAAGGSRPDVVLGHSFGGKVALEMARRDPAGLRQVWVVDSLPSAREPGGTAWRMLDVLRRHPGPFGEREEAVEALETEGYDRLVARWMATNLEQRDDGLRWALNLDGLEALLEDFFRTDLWNAVEHPPGGLEIHVVKAEDSDVLSEEDCRRVERAAEASGRTRLHRLEGGHWLNVSNPDGLIDLLRRRLPR